MITGSMAGTGKSTIAQLYVSLYPDYFVTVPIWEDTFPLSSITEDHQVLNFNDFRIQRTVNKSTFLNILECKPNMKIAQKGRDHVVVDLSRAVVLMFKFY